MASYCHKTSVNHCREVRLAEIPSSIIDEMIVILQRDTTAKAVPVFRSACNGAVIRIHPGLVTRTDDMPPLEKYTRKSLSRQESLAAFLRDGWTLTPLQLYI